MSHITLWDVALLVLLLVLVLLVLRAFALV